MVNIICQCGHQNNSHTENGCNFPTCSCEKFCGLLTIDDEKIEQVANKLLENIQEKLDKLDPQASKKNMPEQVRPESAQDRKRSQSDIWDEVEAHWEKVDELTDDEEYDEVDKEIEIILGIKFENISAWIKKGHNNVNLKKYNDAIFCYNNALILDKKENKKLDKKDYKILNFIGRAHKYNNNYDVARNFFKASLKIKEDFVPALEGLGLSYRDSNEYESAVEQFKKLLITDENNIDALDHLGYCYEYQEEYNEAIECYENSKQMEGKNDEDNYADVRLARCYLLKGDLEHAELLINKEKITRNEKNRSYEIRGMIYQDKKEYDKAIENFEKYLVSDPDSYSTLYSIAWCYGELGNHVFAIEYYKTYMEIRPTQNTAYAIGYELEKMERIEEANDWYGKQLLEFPQETRMWENKGLICRTSENLHESIECWDKILEITPNDAWILLKKSNDLSKIGKTEEALQCLDKITSTDRKEDDPKENIMLNTKGWILIQSGKPKEGLKYVEDSLKLDSTNPSAIDSKAVGLFNLEKYEEAKKCYEEKYQITDAELDQIWIGICMKYCGDQVEENQSESKKHYDDAIKVYDLVLEKNNQNDEAWFQKARVNFDLKKYEESIKNCQEAIKIDPNDARYWEEIGDATNMTAKHTQAIIYYTKANEFKNTTYLLTQIASCLSVNKRDEEAIVWANKSLKIESTCAAQSIKGNALNLQKKYEEAIVCYDECLKIDSNDTETLADKGNAFRRWGKYEEAIENLKKAIALNPEFYWACARKCNTYRDWEKYEEAIEVAEKMLKQFPDKEVTTIKSIIKIYRKMNDEEKVKEWKEKLEKLRRGK